MYLILPVNLSATEKLNAKPTLRSTTSTTKWKTTTTTIKKITRSKTTSTTLKRTTSEPKQTNNATLPANPTSAPTPTTSKSSIISLKTTSTSTSVKPTQIRYFSDTLFNHSMSNVTCPVDFNYCMATDY